MIIYPAQIDTNLTLPMVTNGITSLNASVFNNLVSGILAIENTLGVNPAGTYSTVVSRLVAIEDSITNISGIISLAGDLGGTLQNPLVIGIQGNPISSATPTTNESLIWNGIVWAPSLAFVANGDLDGTPFSQVVVGLQNKPISQTAPTTNQVLQWNGTYWTPSTISTSPIGPAHGDLGNNFPSPIVIGLNGIPLATSTSSPANNDLLLYSSGANQWILTSSSSIFTPGGDLTGTSTSQVVGSADSGNISFGSGNLTFSNSTATISQVSINSSSAAGNIYIQGQPNTGTGNGGAVVLIGGTSSGGTGGAVGMLAEDTAFILNQNGDTGMYVQQDMISIFSLHNVPIAIGAAPSDGYTAILVDTSNDSVSLPALAGNGDGYLAIDNAGLISWSAGPSGGNDFVAAGDLSGTTSSQTVIGIQGVSVSGTAPTTGYVLTATSSSAANWQVAPSGFSAAGDLSGNSSSQRVIGLQDIPVLSGIPTDGYVLTYNSVGNQWEPQSVSTGDVELGGDVIGISTATAVVGIQNQQVLSTDPATVGNYDSNLTNARLTWDGYHWGPAQPAVYEYIGKSPPSNSIDDLIDDAPFVQDIINMFAVGTGQLIGNTGVYLNLVNTNFLTPLDLSPITNSGTGLTINIYGTHRFLQGKAELYITGGIALQGAQSPGSSGNTFGAVGGAGILGFASNSTFGPEPTAGTTDGYVDTNYYQLVFIVFQTSIPPLSDPNLLGEVFTIISASDSSYEGANWMFIADNTNDATNIYGYLAWIGDGPVPTGGASAISWSIGSGLSLRTGTGAAIEDVLGTATTIRVWNTAPMNTLQHQYTRAWMGLSNCNNSDLNIGCFRVMGWDKVNNTTFLLGQTLYLNSFSGPDYGVGGTSGSPTIQTYWANAAVTLSVHNTVANLGITTGGPAIMVGGGDGDQNYNINGCYLGGYETLVSVPLIIDSVFWVYVSNCTIGSNGANMPASIYLAGSVNNNTYTGLIKFTNIITFNYVFWVDGAYISVNNIELDQVISEAVPVLPNRDYAAMVVLGVTGNGGAWYIHNSGTADTGTPNTYIMESYYPAYNAVLNGGQGADVIQIQIDTSFAIGSGVGPILSVGADVIFNNSGFGHTVTPNWNTSMISGGVIDGQMIGNGDDFSPVITLPYQLPLQPIATLADWEALSGIAGVSDVDADGYQIIGPDGRPGFYIRLSNFPNYKVLCDYTNTTITNAQVGDTFICFARIKGSNPNFFAPTGGIIMQVDAGSKLQNNEGSLSVTNVGITPQYSANRLGGQWLDVCAQASVIHTDGNPADFAFAIVLYPDDTGNNDLIIDPESIAVLYLPVSLTQNDGYNTGSSNTIGEYVRLYRKIRRQITGATVGDVAIPSRNGLSFGASTSSGSRMQTDGYTTSSTSATTMFSYVVPVSQAFNITVDWVAIVPSAVSSGRISGGSFMVIGYNNAGTVTASLQTVGTLYNCGSGGAANAVPIDITESANTINIQVVAETASLTDWQFSIRQTNAN